jgi:hypothetical protein
MARTERAIFDAGGLPGAPQGWAGILRKFAAVVTAPEERSDSTSPEASRGHG